MALKKSITIFGDIEINNAYLRVENVSIFDKSKLVFSIVGRKNSDSQIISSNSYNCEYKIDGENPIKQAYIYAKTLPEYSGALDC